MNKIEFQLQYIVLAKYHISYECLKCKRTRKNKNKSESTVKGERNCAIFSASGKNHRRYISVHSILCRRALTLVYPGLSRYQWIKYSIPLRFCYNLEKLFPSSAT